MLEILSLVDFPTLQLKLSRFIFFFLKKRIFLTKKKREKYPIVGVKALDFSDFCKASKLIKDKAHLTEKGLENIRLIKAGMNRGRKS